MKQFNVGIVGYGWAAGAHIAAINAGALGQVTTVCSSRALADAGCRVDFAARRAWFPPALVERQVAAQRGRYRMVRSSLWYPFCRSLPENDVAMPEEFIVDYLESAHTRAHFRQVGWNPRLFDRRYCDRAQPAPCGDEKMLQQADQTWRQQVTSQPAPNLDPAMRRELDRIVSAARKELLV